MPKDNDGKRALRQEMARRRDAAANEHPEAAAAAGRNLLGLLRSADQEVVAGYLPIRSELDPRPVMATLVEQSAVVCVPQVVGAGIPLTFLRWEPDMEMREGRFGTSHPASSDPRVPTIVVAPLLAWDRSGTRLGYGGGYYDRTLASLAESRASPMVIGFGFAVQEAAQIPCDSHDRGLDAMVTEREVVLWRDRCAS